MLNLILTSALLFPPNNETILTSVSQNTRFTDGKPDGVDGIKVTVVTFPDFDKITVKMPGVTAPITQDEIDAANTEGKFVWVKFEGFKAKTYQNFKTKENGISASAKGMTICSKTQNTPKL